MLLTLQSNRLYNNRCTRGLKPRLFSLEYTRLGRLVWEFSRIGDYIYPKDAPAKCVEHESFLSSTSDRHKAIDEFAEFMELNNLEEYGVYDTIPLDKSRGRVYGWDHNDDDINEYCSDPCDDYHVYWEMELIDRQVYVQYAGEHGEPYDLG